MNQCFRTEMKNRDVHILNINSLNSLQVASLPRKCQNGVLIFTHISECCTQINIFTRLMAGNSGIGQPVSTSSRLFVYLLLCVCTNKKQLAIIKQDLRFLTNLDTKLSLYQLCELVFFTIASVSSGHLFLSQQLNRSRKSFKQLTR